MELNSHVKDYLDYCKFQKNLSLDTLKAYQIDLFQFVSYWNSTSGEFSRTNISGYIVSLQKAFQPRTAKRKTASVKVFCNWLEYMEFLEHNPFTTLRVKFNEPYILPRTIPLDTVSGILSAAY